MFIFEVVVRNNCNVQGVVQHCNVQGEQGGEKGLQGVKDVVQQCTVQGGVQGVQGVQGDEQGVQGGVQQCHVQGGVQQQRTLCGLLPDRRHRLQLHRPCQHLHIKPYNRPCE